MANSNPVPRPGNLRPPWKPGQFGNPAGSSRARRRRAELIRLIDSGAAADELAKRLEADGLADEAARVWLKLALSGHWPAFKRLLCRIDGPVLPQHRWGRR